MGTECPTGGTQDGAFRLVRTVVEQRVEGTRSRRTGPRKWLRAVRWLIAAGLHPKATATTARVAGDLAKRMDYTLGHVRYAVEEMARRLGMSARSVARHVAYLREMGSLAWVEHGSRLNVRRLLGVGGYAGTATVYAAVIPAVYDEAMGHTVIGTGYAARIVIDERTPAGSFGWPEQVPGTPREATPKAATPVDNSPVDNPGSQALVTPSLAPAPNQGQVQMSGGGNYTLREGAEPSTDRVAKGSSSKGDRSRTAADVRQAMTVTKLVRALVNWTQKVPLRRLEWVLRPLTDQGADAYDIAADLTAWCPGTTWRPQRPDAFIAAQIGRSAEWEQRLAAQAPPAGGVVSVETSSQEWRAWVALTALLDAPAAPRTDDDRAAARTDWNCWPEVIRHYEDNPDDALDLYGTALVRHAIRQDARTNNREETYA